MGDLVPTSSQGFELLGAVVRVTAKYIWVEYISLTSGYHYDLKLHRDEVLIGTKYY